MRSKYFFAVVVLIMLLIGSGCEMDHRSKDDGGGTSSPENDEAKRLASILYLSSSDIDVKSELITNKFNENVISLAEGQHDYMHYKFTKNGGSSSDTADSSGSNAAILAKNSANLTIKGSLIVSSGDHAHGVFSYGEGTNVVVSDCVVTARGSSSSGLMTSSGGTLTSHHVTVETFGPSSPAMHVYSGGGSITARLGKFTTSGASSPAVKSEGIISVSNAKLEALSSQAVVVDGKSSVTFISCDITANHSAESETGNSRYQAVLIRLDSSGNPEAFTGYFSMEGGTLTSTNGDVFYVTNSTANISLNNADITNANNEGAFLRAEAAKWGTSGVNGGHVELSASDQFISGNIYVDGISDLNMYLKDDSYFAGAVNPSNTSARIFVSLAKSKWILTGDSYIDSLSCEKNSINLNGHNLYVAGVAYVEGTESTGEEIDFSETRTKKQTQTNETDTTDGSTTPSFDVMTYSTGTVNGVAYRGYHNRVYVSKPVSGDYQSLSVYIPEFYFSSRTINGYSAQTAPIFIPNNSGGYMAATIMKPQNNNIIGQALARGLVVVSPALRGRNITGGTAPAAVVDYKAVIRYLRANKSRLPAGNTDRIIACGVSSGGALSAVIGASGNSADYDEWLAEIGAAEASDNVFAAVCYCPVTNLDNADGAYEWVFGGTQYGEVSSALYNEFVSYFNQLGLKDGNTALRINDSGQTFLQYMNGLYVQAAQKALDSGTAISADWVQVSGNKAVSADMRKYAASFAAREKGIPAFDKFDLSSAENSLFGYKHFSHYSAGSGTSGHTSTGELAESSVIDAMNPMNYIGSSDTAKYWRIRQGVDDRDITLTIPAILALSLRNSDCNVSFEAVWGQGHGGYYDTDELFDWVDSICK